jgi:hypothetical protein
MKLTLSAATAGDLLSLLRELGGAPRRPPVVGAAGQGTFWPEPPGAASLESSPESPPAAPEISKIAAAAVGDVDPWAAKILSLARSADLTRGLTVVEILQKACGRRPDQATRGERERAVKLLRNSGFRFQRRRRLDPDGVSRRHHLIFGAYA